ncbi:MAG: replicative helicase loader/inhibitor [bacterium]
MVALGRPGVTIVETARVLALMAEGWKDAPSPTGATLQLWDAMLKDLRYPVVVTAVKEAILVGTSWCPKIAEVRRRSTKIAQPDSKIPSTAEAWEATRRAIWRFYDDGQTGLAQLPPPVRKVAQAIGWSALCDEQSSILRAHFIRMYEAERVHAEEMMALPAWFVEEREALSIDAQGELGGGDCE